ncbi:diacylglycerol kinase [Vibrio fluvialis]|uniref:diacylglycerol kinase n=1 Tax=Vibrio fluvialis TaxID=676 RepID=UPI0012AE5704|nr:diacylglycerol kinase [Vibrio fluvialis]EKO3987480.1 diacylglycerol kinase [Vibrio fluvialis]MCG6409377.1 diacylglycerol kinase [Vibrio fluvialis]
MDMIKSGKPGDKGLRRIIKAAKYSFQGFQAALKHEAAVRQELALLLILTPVSLLLDVTNIEKVLLIGSLFIILITELLNSAVEAIVDRVGTEYHELSGRAKDIGSAAVFVALANAAVVWGIILL